MSSENGPTCDAVHYPEVCAHEAPKETTDPFKLVIINERKDDKKDPTQSNRAKSILGTCAKLFGLLILLYFFICSLDLLSNAFRLLGGRVANDAFRSNKILSNPIADMMLGVLATVLLQSSSTTTSIVVSMVAANLLPIRAAIYVVMGANIGTSVTNTLVAMGQAMERDEFRRAFAGATVHDMFNWMTVIVLLPVEWLSGLAFDGCGMLCQLTGWMTHSLDFSATENGAQPHNDLLKTITKPLTKLIIQIDKSLLTNIHANDTTNSTLVKHICHATVVEERSVQSNITGQWVTERDEIDIEKKCVFLFENIANSWSDAAVGGCLMMMSIALLIICLVSIVKTLNSMLRGSVAELIQRILNAKFPGRAAFLTGYVAILVGAGMTMLLQSSSIFTSTLTPLVGIGVLHVDRMYPLTIGSNLGTTGTALLASLTADRQLFHKTLQIALCHLFFNIFGIMIWYPIPVLRRCPIKLAKQLGVATANHRWVALVYLIGMFFIIPAAVFGLTMAGWIAALCVMVPVVLILLFFTIINLFQSRCQNVLPKSLQNWDKLPEGCRSLSYYDQWVEKTMCVCGRPALPEVRERSLTIPRTDSTVAMVNMAFEEEAQNAEELEAEEQARQRTMMGIV